MVKLTDYLGYELHVDEGGRFWYRVQGDDSFRHGAAPSLDEAKKRIDSLVASRRKDLDLELLRLDGLLVTLRKVNGNTGDWMLRDPLTGNVPPSVGQSKLRYFFPSPEARALVDLYLSIERQLEGLSEDLKQWEVELPHSYGRPTAEEISRWMASVAERYAGLHQEQGR